ncbi:MAG TPA: hypothetical protein VMU34_25365 [Mycobacterium sp.]|nr:hypothetical protein [Mycobacterium sp.]
MIRYVGGTVEHRKKDAGGTNAVNLRTVGPTLPGNQFETASGPRRRRRSPPTVGAIAQPAG